MYILTITLKVVPAKREEFITSVRLLHKDITQEKGLKNSSLFQDVDDVNRFNLIEEWETQEDRDNHLRSELHRVLMGAVKVLGEQSEVRYNYIGHQTGREVLIQKGTKGQSN